MKPAIRDRPALAMSNKLWQQSLEELRRQMTKATYQTWLAHSRVIDSTTIPTGLTVAVPNDYAKEWLADHLRDIAIWTVSAIAGQAVTVDFVVMPRDRENPPVAGRKIRINKYSAEQASDILLAKYRLQTGHFDLFPSKASVSPISAAALPRNLLINKSQLKGAQDPMTVQYNPIRVRIYSHITQSTFLHVEDALIIGKLRLFAGSYQRGNGITANAHHFLNTADARVVLLALAQAEPGFTYREYKGSGNGGADVISRVFSVKAKADRVYLELKNGPGRLTNTGAIQPNGKPAAEITIPFKTFEAQRLAVETLAYLQAWDVLRLDAQREVVSGFLPYPLSPPPPDIVPGKATSALPISEVGDVELLISSDKPAHKTSIARPAGTKIFSSSAFSPDNGKAAATDRRRQTHGELSGTDPNHSPSSHLLHYQDGTLVDPNNENERKAFLQYRKDNGEDPNSLASLRNFYLQNHGTG